MKTRQPMKFEGLGLRHYSRGPFRVPRKGEYFAQSGKQATKAKEQTRAPRRIVTPIGDIIGEKR